MSLGQELAAPVNDETHLIVSQSSLISFTFADRENLTLSLCF